MEPTDQGEVPKLGQVIQIDEGKIQEHLGEVVRSTVEETWNAMLDAEAVVFLPCRAIRTDRGSKRYQVGVTTSGTYRRKRVKSH
jgi:putative transposase